MTDDPPGLVAVSRLNEHHTGHALNIGSPNDPDLDECARTDGFRWLRRHAGHFGFHLSYPRGNPHGIAYEPWHWCWRNVGARREKPAYRSDEVKIPGPFDRLTVHDKPRGIIRWEGWSPDQPRPVGRRALHAEPAGRSAPPPTKPKPFDRLTVPDKLVCPTS